MNRRKFISDIALGSAGVIAAGSPLKLIGKVADLSVTRLTILHTNDVHSRLDPFPMDGSRLQGLGGVSRRSALINEIRQKERNVLLFDSGDILQGTPYFNMFLGKPEFELMSMLKYDAATMGNHDFDLGIQHLADLQQYASFPLLNINYDLKNTPLAGKVLPYKVFVKEDIRIGVFGIGINLKGLVAETHFPGLQYTDPVDVANETAARLRKDEKCNLVVCLSHIGYQYKHDPNKISDVILAEKSRDIDIILGGHTHTFLDTPDLRKNLEGETVLINQTGWGGLRLGRLDIVFERNKKQSCETCNNIWIRN